jgi:hypothetical protein
MTFQKLCSAIAKIEGKKSQVKIGDIREIVSTMAKLMAEDSRYLGVLWGMILREYAKRQR